MADIVERKPARRIRWMGTVSSRSDAASLLHAAGDAVLVERGRPRWLVLSCPCGCGEQLPVNLDPRAGPAWRFYRSNSALTLYPSVWRESGCESHFIIWRDQILLFGGYDDDFDGTTSWEDGALRDAVLAALPSSRELVSFSDIAETIDAIPWDVLQACRQLVRNGAAREGTKKKRGWFGRS